MQVVCWKRKGTNTKRDFRGGCGGRKICGLDWEFHRSWKPRAFM